MVGGYFELPGVLVKPELLQQAEAGEMVAALRRNAYCRIVECRRDESGTEYIVFDAEIEVPQVKKYDILPVERLAAVFTGSDLGQPRVLAMREMFPQVPHLNLGLSKPFSLCLFAEPAADVRLQWTAPRALERIRSWLALTAKGQLHAQDQPLEPLLLGATSQLVLPDGVFGADEQDRLLVVSAPVDGGHGLTTYVGSWLKAEQQLDRTKTHCVVSLLRCPAQSHGTITLMPGTLAELHGFLSASGCDLIGVLRGKLTDWRRYPDLYALGLIIVVELPKTRVDGGPMEAWEYRAFRVECSIGEVGVALGVLAKQDGYFVPIVGNSSLADGGKVKLIPMNVHFALSRRLAGIYSGLGSPEQPQIALVGVGALGSQMFLNLARMGYGRWFLIDNDVLLPHNLGRHALTDQYVGRPKAIALARMANQLVGDDVLAVGVAMDALESENSKELQVCFAKADVILDVSTSIAVARHLVYGVPGPARRMSIFLNPQGNDLVLLAEDRGRTCCLDALELQYYRGLTREASLAGHLARNSPGVRYAGSCRDLSATIGQDFVAMHAAIAAHAFRRVIADDAPAITVWHGCDETGTIERYDLPAAISIPRRINGWTLLADGGLIEHVSKLRETKLPNETGGVLIGAYDHQRRIVYVVDTIPSPSDSEEWPTVYIRGCRGLPEELERIRRITDGRLEYVGEWHSHPCGADCTPSNDDREAFALLDDEMSAERLPALMLIAADEGRHEFYLERMSS